MLPESDLEAVVQRTITLYNRLRSPEIKVKLVFLSPAMLTVSFTGGFCYGCGILDYVEAFTQEFKILSSKAELKVNKTRQINARTFEADFTIKTRNQS
jgi:hypothetical protein